MLQECYDKTYKDDRRHIDREESARDRVNSKNQNEL